MVVEPWEWYIIVEYFFRIHLRHYRCIITEFERKVNFQNYPFKGGYVLKIDFLKLFNNDDKKCKRISTENLLVV